MSRPPTAEEFQHRLEATGVDMYGENYIFYFPDAQAPEVTLDGHFKQNDLRRIVAAMEAIP